jgi:hypothetical protein
MVIVTGLAGWRLAAMLSYEAGPWGAFERLRRAVGTPPPGPQEITGFLPLLFGCVWCIGWWTAALMLGLMYWFPAVPLVFAAAAVVVAMERIARP